MAMRGNDLDDALWLLAWMDQNAIKPDSPIYSVLLDACSESGLIEVGVNCMLTSLAVTETTAARIGKETRVA